MSTTAPNFDVLSNELWPTQSSQLVRNIVLAVVGSILLTVSAKVQIPLYPVPVTLQTLVVLLIGFTYGPKLAGATVAFYLAQGAMGYPVFAGTPDNGLVYMTGPTGGYLLGFLVAAVVCGLFARDGWDRRWSTMIFGMVIGNLIIYAFGLLWLGSVLGWDQPILQSGMTPFLLGDAVKIAIAAILMPAVWKKVSKR